MRSLFGLAALIGFCAGAQLEAAEPEATPGEWKLVSATDNVVIYRRSRPGPGHYESKAIGEIAASTAAVQAVIDDADAYPRFMPYTVECRVLKKEGDSVLAYQRLSPPLISDRDYTLRIRTTSKRVEGGTSYRSQWHTENARGPAERPGIVRVELCEGGWLLEPVGPNATRATYSVYTDSGGMIPVFIKNTGSQVGIRRIFAAIRKQVRDPKYKAEIGGRRAEDRGAVAPGTFESFSVRILSSCSPILRCLHFGSAFPPPPSAFELPASSIRTLLSR